MLSLILVAAALLSPTAEAPAKPSEESIARFIAALPPATQEESGPDPLQAMQEEGLRERNPGQDAKLEPILADHRKCSDAASKRLVAESLRATAVRLGAGKLQRLTAFYEGADYQRFTALLGQEEKAPLEGEQKAALDHITASYPLEDFTRAMQAVAQDVLFPIAIEAFTACDQAREKALTAAGLEL